MKTITIVLDHGVEIDFEFDLTRLSIQRIKERHHQIEKRVRERVTPLIAQCVVGTNEKTGRLKRLPYVNRINECLRGREIATRLRVDSDTLYHSEIQRLALTMCGAARDAVGDIELLREVAS